MNYSSGGTSDDAAWRPVAWDVRASAGVGDVAI